MPLWDENDIYPSLIGQKCLPLCRSSASSATLNGRCSVLSMPTAHMMHHTKAIRRSYSVDTSWKRSSRRARVAPLMLAHILPSCCLHTHSLVSHPPWRHMASGGSRLDQAPFRSSEAPCAIAQSPLLKERGRVGPQTVRATPDCWVNHPRRGWAHLMHAALSIKAHARPGQVRMTSGLPWAKQRQPVRKWNQCNAASKRLSRYCRILHPYPPRTPCSPRSQNKKDS